MTRTNAQQKTYLDGRQSYKRPEAMLWSTLPPTTYTDGNGVTYYIPQGAAVGDTTTSDDFLILSDHNRKDISFKPQRIEKRERMINGRMRSYHIADKLTISTSWENLPSRAFSAEPIFNNSGKPALGYDVNGTAIYAGGNLGSIVSPITQWTVDGGAGGNELLNWYDTHTGSFWVFIAYDKHNNFPATGEYAHLGQYNQVIEMFISSFDYNVSKRGGTTYDMWNISVSLEEV